MRAWILVGLAYFLCFPECRAEFFEHTDGVFNPDDWTTEVVARPPGTVSGFLGEAAQTGDGQGNPDPYRRVIVSRTPAMAGPDTSTRLYSLNTGAAYDSCFAGAINYVDMGIDAIQFQGGSGGLIQPALSQDGVLYVADGVLMPEQSWNFRVFSDLGQNNFYPVGSPAVHPNFSLDGAPISFGFAYTVSTGSDQPVMRTVGFDNWTLLVDYAAQSPFFINAGLNDAWFNALSPGQGFFFTVFPDLGSFFLAWFTYDTERPPENPEAILGEPGHRWLTAFGPYSGDSAVLDVELTAGGEFNMTEPVPVQQPDGTIMLEFSDCNTGLVTFDISTANVQGEVAIERIALDNVPACEAAAEAQ